MSGTAFLWDDASAQAMFKRLADAGRNAAPMLSSLAYSLQQRVALTFNDQRDPWGTPWEPLRPATLEQRRDKGRGGVSILRDTGQLLISLAGAVTRGAAEIRIGFVDRPATIHQFGGQAGRGHKTTIKARPMLPIRPGGRVDMPPTWRDEIVDAMTAHIEAAA